MKKILAIALCLAMAFGLVACGGTGAMTMGTGGTSGTYYAYGGVLGRHIKEKAGVNVTVNHYVESLDGTDWVITENETVSAETGSSLNGAAYQKTYEGFTYADADKNVTVMADGSTVINVYYTRNSYNVTFTYGDKIGESVRQKSGLSTTCSCGYQNCAFRIKHGLYLFLI